MNLTVPHNFHPRPYQLPLLQALDSGYNRAVIVWHRRAGKDKTLVNLIAKKMLERVGTYYYFFPTYAQGRKILWDGADREGFRFLNHFPTELLDGKPNDQQMKLRFRNGSLFQIIGTDDYDSIVGTNPVGCVFSEYSLQNPAVWDFIRPILAENGGWAVFNFTPRGKNHGFDLYEAARNDPTWFCQLLTVDDTCAISTIVLEQERKEILEKNGDDALFLQEYYCSFVAAVQGSYYWKQVQDATNEGRIGRVPYDPGVPVHTVWDLGIADAMAVGFYQRVGFEVHMIDYIEDSGGGLPGVIKQVKERPYVYGLHFAPHDIRNRELGTGKSRWEVAQDLGITFEDVPNLPVQDGIEAGRMFFRILRIDAEKCRRWLKAIPQYTKTYDEVRKTFSNTPYHDWTSHPADEHRYAALVADRMTGRIPTFDYDRIQQVRANKAKRE